MTEPKPVRKRLSHHVNSGAKPAKTLRKKRAGTEWVPNPKSITLDEAMRAPAIMAQGSYSAKAQKHRVHPWEAIATDYIEGVHEDPDDPDSKVVYYSHKELSEKWGAEIYLIKERSSKEQWMMKRQAFQLVEAQKRMQSRKIEVLGKSIEFDDNALKVSEMGMSLVRIRLGEVVQEVKARQSVRERALADATLGRDYKKSDLYSAIHTRDLESIAKATAMFQEIGMKALGTDIIRHEISGMDTSIYIDNSDNSVKEISINEEMAKDDPDRLAAILSSLQDANLLPGVVDNILEESDLHEIESIASTPTDVVEESTTNEDEKTA